MINKRALIFHFYKLNLGIYLAGHIVVLRLRLFNELNHAVWAILFLKIIQYAFIYVYMKSFASGKLVFYMNLNLRIRDLFVSAFVFDFLVTSLIVILGGSI